MVQRWVCTQYLERKPVVGTQKQAMFTFHCRLCQYHTRCTGPTSSKLEDKTKK